MHAEPSVTTPAGEHDEMQGITTREGCVKGCQSHQDLARDCHEYMLPQVERLQRNTHNRWDYYQAVYSGL